MLTLQSSHDSAWSHTVDACKYFPWCFRVERTSFAIESGITAPRRAPSLFQFPNDVALSQVVHCLVELKAGESDALKSVLATVTRLGVFDPTLVCSTPHWFF